MSILSKNYIKRSFDKASKSYSGFSELQNEIAKSLTFMIESDFFGNILEIGVGDGKLANLIKFSYNNYIGIDLSLNMAHLFKKNHPKKYSIVADGENLPFASNTFDLIISSSVFQWFSNPENSIPKLLDLLKDKKNMFFSVFSKGTFWQMHEISKITGFGSVLDLKDKLFYENLGFDCKMVQYTVYYKSVKDFLHSHKKSGARYTNQTTFCAKSKFFEFCSMYEKLFGTQKGIEVTYVVNFCKKA
ncbi:MAG: methyltransferase domain-containing protein [Desulfurella sp.]|uniref:Malonyl-CoA O-methyltransferase n=1 Tax=Desulfurella multipotens TaxID=79269 RepID=A0A1G6MFP2_9BACT|nr:methyltransferase domain-containing protein [Desulfurella multipotens]SDC54372.1 malonyl-CoA O-methyltransferase [Desulfurella multipotens]HEX13367.1 methyltransferase domain-containing protein [Desulfurella acetivorans]